ncbi:MAG: thiamine phosphate synthase, partial [Bacteroidaceae bacterium]|nr:thiamine phosphate synthase [Bacteroidaceae bacterium]
YKKQYDYLLLSPIYNSISKPGYDTPFSTQQLTEAHNSRIIDSRVVAMGGITPENISSTMRYGFGGVAILGCLWNNLSIEHISDTIYNIKEQLSCYNS